MKRRVFLSLVITSALIISSIPGLRCPAYAAPTAAPTGADETPNEADAEVEGEEIEEAPAAKALELVVQVNAALQVIRDDGGKLDTARGENREILFDRLILKREAILDDLPKLVAEVKRLREEKLDDQGAGAETERLLAETLSMMRRDLPRRRRVAKLRAERDAAQDEERLELEATLVRQNLRWDELLANMYTIAELEQQLGLDVDDHFAVLDRELTERSELRAGQFRVAMRRLSEVQQEAADLTPEEAVAAVRPLERRAQRVRESLEGTLKLMDNRGLDTSEFRQMLLATTGEITGDVLSVSVVTGLISDWLESLGEWVIEEAPGAIFKLMWFAGIVLFFRVIAGFVRRLVAKGLVSRGASFSRLLQEFFLMTSYRAVMLLGVLIALSQLGVEIGPLLAGLGVAGFIVGFALQNTLSNFASGLMILAYRPFDVGDVIQAAGVSGSVAQLNLVSTTIRTFDNQRLIVPNTKIWGDVITNVTAEKVRRVDLVFGIGYGDDIEKAGKVLLDIVANHPLVLKDPEPVVKLHTLGESSVDFVVRPWSKTSDYWTVYWDVTREVKRRFDAEKISIPFPQRDVHVFKEA
jgi:small conductance mechanosensitive channel